MVPLVRNLLKLSNTDVTLQLTELQNKVQILEQENSENKKQIAEMSKVIKGMYELINNLVTINSKMF